MSERNMQSNVIFGGVGVQPSNPTSPTTRTFSLHRETAAQNSQFMDTRGAWHEATSPFEGHPRHRPPRVLQQGAFQALLPNPLHVCDVVCVPV